MPLKMNANVNVRRKILRLYCFISMFAYPELAY